MAPEVGPQASVLAYVTCGFIVERATGIEPAWPAWKAGALPLSYARVPVPPSVAGGARRTSPGCHVRARGAQPTVDRHWTADRPTGLTGLSPRLPGSPRGVA